MKTTKPNHGLRPVTVKQIFSMGEDHCIDGAVVEQVTVVGNVIATDRFAATNGPGWSQCRISDGTGSVLCREWRENRTTFQLGQYLRAHGSVARTQGIPTITGVIRVVTDSNETTFHFLSAIHAHLRLTKPPPPHTQRK